MADKLFRDRDPGRGPFTPEERHPIRNEDNPAGTRRIDKTRQDRMPVAQRPRVIEAEKRREAMQNA